MSYYEAAINVRNIMNEIDSVLNRFQSAERSDDTFAYFHKATKKPQDNDRETILKNMSHTTAQSASKTKKRPEPQKKEEEKKPVQPEEIYQACIKHQRYCLLDESEEDTKDVEYIGLSEAEFVSLFPCFIPVRGMQEQISHVLAAAYRESMLPSGNRKEHIVIQTEKGNGGVMLATGLSKAIEKITGESVKAGKVTGEDLNRYDPAEAAIFMDGGHMVISEAGKMDSDTVQQLEWALKHDQTGMKVILIDDEKSLETLFGENKGMQGMFTGEIKIPYFSADELMQFARVYARKKGYTLDTSGRARLRRKINDAGKCRMTVSQVAYEVEQIAG